MPTNFDFQYRFHPAGQGVFASGTVWEYEAQIPFHWVMDCGSTAHKAVLFPVVGRFRDLIVQNHLDLLCISHFDNDHVSGLTDLLKDLHIGTVVLPYYTPLERLLLGSKAERIDPEYAEFVGNPVAFLLERAASIDEIIIVGEVPPQDDGGSPLPDRPPSPGEPKHDNQPRRDYWRFKYMAKEHAEPLAIIDQETNALCQRLNTQVIALPGPLECLAVPSTGTARWEFLFFHKPVESTILEAAREGVTKIVEKSANLNISTALSSSAIRARIKKLYAKVMKQSAGGEDINSTSMCVYSGPELESFEWGGISSPWPNSLIGSFAAPSGYVSATNRPSILYTGDANFSKEANRVELHAFLALQRRLQVGILQVPHHGSRFNWEVGSSEEFAHRFSIFCADETNLQYKHPHREVLLDLLHRGPVLANVLQGWSWRGSAVCR